ncbi:GntR family transcriptional regulator [Patulibacter sp. NPDC049589]|uniref:GntR family transcriptional regulator n=1 Tax=Patulibacter sp. NPDC049589 TaxID=3154731 RepID=UPI0034275D2C
MKTDPDPRPAAGGNNLVDEIATAIRARIMSGEIAIGAQLRQAELAGELGVSRTPIREALRQLQSGGLIEVLPNRGAIVRVPVPWQVREAYEVRAQLEAFACELAVRHITGVQVAGLRAANGALRDATANPSGAARGECGTTTDANDEFHTTIHLASGNERLARTINEINETFPRNVSALVLADDPRHSEESISEHDRIVDAIAAGDVAAARREMIAHVVGAGEHLARWYERRSSTVFVG